MLRKLCACELPRVGSLVPKRILYREFEIHTQLAGIACLTSSDTLITTSGLEILCLYDNCFCNARVIITL